MSRASHVLGRLTWGPRPGEVERVEAGGIEAFVERQLAPERIDDARVEALLRGLPTLAMSIAELHRDFPRPEPAVLQMLASGEMTPEDLGPRMPPERRPRRMLEALVAARVLRAVASERQLQEIMVDFWFNHFNVHALKAETRWYVGAYERDAIRPHALGRFRDLLGAVARHPAMLYYLDAWLSAREGFIVPVGPGAGRVAGLNENYARELLELHTLGVAGGYTQADVREVARAFTGWSIERPQAEARFVFRPRVHDRGPKTVLGHRLPAGGGQEDGERVLDLLARHPATARHLATRLARRLVADDPPASLVARVATAYLGSDGDIREMLRALVASPEFAAAETLGAKLKRPLEYVVSAVRALDATIDTTGALALARAAGRMGERLYQAEAPTGYPDRAEAWLGPGAMRARLDFAVALAEGRLRGVRPRAARDAAAETMRPEVARALLVGAPGFHRR